MSASRKNSGFDAAKFDAHVITQEEYDEIPEITDEQLARAVFKPGRGRPPGSTKTALKLRIDNDVIEAFRSTGDGWQTRMNDALRNQAKKDHLL